MNSGSRLAAGAALALAAAASIPATIAAAQPVRASRPGLPALAGRVLLSGCRQGECGWLRVTRVERVSASARGELRRATGRWGTSVHGRRDPPRAYRASLRVRWDRRERNEYAFCSRERPAHAFPDEGDGLVVHYLDLFDLAGYQYSSATMYMRICHDRAFDPARPAALRRLGYRPGTRSEQVENGTPADLTRF